MRVAIAVDKGVISAHFGHCEQFLVYNIENQTIMNVEALKNPPHQKGFLPNFLESHDIDCLITGSIGGMAVKLLDELNIRTIRGVSGKPEDIIERFINDSLESSDEICEEHAHHNH